MNNNDWQEYARNYKPLVDTGREPLPLMKYPDGLLHKMSLRYEDDPR